MMRLPRGLAGLLAFVTALAVLLLQHGLGANSTPQALPFGQSWTDTNLIAVNDNWSGVPGIVGHRGDDLTTAIGTDPQTILVDGTTTPVNVFANQANGTFGSGGVAEFDGIADPTIAIQGSGTADAPFVLFNLDTTGLTSVNVSYTLRDLDPSPDNAVQQVALQFRIGSAGDFTNVPAGYVPDATDAGAATRVTPISVTLPASTDDQPLVQLRIITTNAAGNDEWVGIDDITVTSAGSGPTDPSATGAASPALVQRGTSALLTATVTPGANPASTALTVTADLSAIGGATATTFFDDGVFPDSIAADNIFSFSASVSLSVAAGVKSIPVTILDAQSRTASTVVTLEVVDPTLPPPVNIAPVPFIQDWSSVHLIATNDDWAGVPGIIGYLGDYTTASPTNVDPQTLVADMAATIDVIANQGSTSSTTGGVAEFDGIPNPTIGLQGSGTADAPHIVLSLDTVGFSNVTVAYNVRDIDGSSDNATQAVALQYRVGPSGSYTNLPAGFIADATTGPDLATLVTPVSVQLPADAANQPLVQIRILTANAVGGDEWVGIDDISVTGNDPTMPSGFGAANPSSAEAGMATLLTVTVIPAINPVSTGLGVVADLAPIGGSPAQGFFDDGSHGDATAADHVFSYLATVATGTTPGLKSLPFVVSDAELRTTPSTISLTVVAPTPFITIGQVQGPGLVSPYAGQIVKTSGIVTGVKTNGFFLQSAADDGDLTTSDGVFVFTLSAPPSFAAVGNLVEVTGLVQEFVPAADPLQPPLTEIVSPIVALLSTGVGLPAPIVLTATDPDPSGSIVQLERYEGMRVLVDSLTVIAPTQGNLSESNATSASNGVFYGVVTGVARPFREPGVQVPDPLPIGAPATVTRFDANPERLRIDSDAIGGLPLDVAAGQVLTNVVGPLDYGFRTYTILPDPGSVGVGSAIAPRPVSQPTADQFTVGSTNLQRFFDDVNDPAIGEVVLTTAAFNNRLNKASLFVRGIMRSPDIIGAIEVENLSTLQALANRINDDSIAAGQADPGYAAYLEEGNDVGGIDVGFLVKGSIVTVIDVTQVGRDTTFVDPNDGSVDLLNDRPPLVLRATVPGPAGTTFPITAIVNHLRSLGGVESDGRVRAKRRAQAEFLAALIQDRQLGDPGERIISVGDYNAFEFSDGYVDVIGTIAGAPTPADQVVLASPDLVNPNLIDLVETVPADQRYSYSFDGSAQVLDHALVTDNLLSQIDSVQFGRVDADFADTARNDPSVPTRLSDHDPLVVFVNTRTVLPALSIDSVSVREPVSGTVAAVFTVTLSAPSGREVSVTYATANGSATAGSDYSGVPAAPSSTLTFAPGETSKPLAITVNADRVPEPAQFFLVNLSAPAHATLSVRQGRGTILDAASPRVDTFSPSSAMVGAKVVIVGEGFAGTLAVRFNKAFAAFRVDSPRQITALVPSLATDGPISVTNILGTGTSPDAFYVMRSLRIDDVRLVEGDSGTTSAVFTVRLSASSSRDVSVDFATADDTARAGQDYTVSAGTLTFPAGTRQRSIMVPITGDKVAEGNEVFFVNLSRSVNAIIDDARGRGTILNDDRAR